MRWYWVDQFLEFESGRHAKAIKLISLAEDHMHDHFPAYPVMPQSLVIEGMAQTGGLLVCEHSGFVKKVVLAKLPKATFYCEAVPGDTLTYTAVIESLGAEGAKVNATSHLGERLHAEAEIVFAYLNHPEMGALFDPETFLHMMRLMGAYRIGRAADGGALCPPSNLIAAEKARLQRETRELDQ